MTVRIVTDSSADIPEKLLKELEIESVSLNIHFGEEVFVDNIDIWSDEFYNRLRNEAILPNTSQPAPGEFLKAYQKLALPGQSVISIHISREMSGTINAAELAAKMVENNAEIHIFDSANVSMGLGLQVIQAARLAKKGASVAEIITALEKWRDEVKLYFTVNTLEYLSRTGRIGKASAMVGGLLNIKPILGVDEGFVAPVAKVRGNLQKISQEMVATVKADCGDRPVIVSILHSDWEESVEYLEKLVAQEINVAELLPGTLGPIIGAHAGPNVFGLVVLPVD